ncbi:acyl-CoA N-acyltransferase [Cladochytrium replicatum]|nr:acyl-CoA N-acyltransferase [Cladochytrium replicatum]
MPRIETLDLFPVKTERCTIRFFDPTKDVEQLQKAADNPLVARYLTNNLPAPYTMEDARIWAELQSYEAVKERFVNGKNRHLPGLCVEIDGEVCGSIGYGFNADLGHRTITVGYWFAESVWGKGIATECVRWLVDFITKEEPTAIRLEAAVFAPNHGSRRVLEKCGFTCESRSRAAITRGDRLVYDELMMAYIFEDRLKKDVEYTAA